MQIQDKQRLHKLIKDLVSFINHKDFCTANLPESNPTSDFCNCKIAEVRQRAYDIVKELLL